jgi:hypothetical protein
MTTSKRAIQGYNGIGINDAQHQSSYKQKYGALLLSSN